MKLIIAGGRHYRMSPEDWARLDEINAEHGVEEVVSGCASGADQCGELWARHRRIPVKRFEANWKTHGLRAGPIRNGDMAAYADAVALFPGGRGTASMHQQAVNAGITIYDFRT